MAIDKKTPHEENNKKDDFIDDFYAEATKDSKEAFNKLDKQIEEIKNDSIYKTPSSLDSNKYKYTQEALYCDLGIDYNNKNIYFRINRKDSNFGYSFGYFDGEIAEDNFEFISPTYTNKKPITVEDKQRNKILGFYAKNKFAFKDQLYEIAITLSNTKDYEVITDDFKIYEEIATDEEVEESESDTLKFSEYPEDIQEEAIKQIQDDTFFDNLMYSVNISHAGDTTLKEMLVLVFGSIFVGEPVQTEVGGNTGEGKSDLVYNIANNIPKGYIQKLRRFSPKYIYYAKDSFNDKYNILLLDDVDFSKEENVETIKIFTDNREKEKTLKTVGKVNSENKALTFSLSGKFLSILTYAKSNPDEELSNRLYKCSVDDTKDKATVRSTIKNNTLIDMNNNKLLERFNQINQCAIQYLIEKEVTVFNPFNILFNPSDFNNRDVSSFISLVNAKSFYHSEKRRVISINGKTILIGSLEDYKFVSERWDNETQKYKLSPNQKKILQILKPYESEEAFLSEVEEKGEEYYRMESSKAKELFKNNLDTVQSLSKKLNVQIKTLKKDLDNSQEKGNKKHLLELGLIYRTPLEPDRYNSSYVYGKVGNMTLDSDKSMDIMDISLLYPYFDNLKVKQSLLIYLINGYNILILSKEKKYISSYCSNYNETINDYDSLCSFIESFVENMGEWSSQDGATIEDLKTHFNILSESETFLKTYIEGKLYPSSKTPESAPNKKLIQDSWIYNEYIHYIHNESDKEEQFGELVVNIDNDISESIQYLLESPKYKKGLTKQKIFEKLEVNEDDDHKILKIEDTLGGLVQKKILRIKTKGFNNLYVLRSE